MYKYDETFYLSRKNNEVEVSILRISDLKPGMTLRKEVKNHSGRKLLPEGTLITEEHILSLKAWGVSEVEINEKGVEPDSPPETEKIDPKKLAKAEKEVELLFCLSNLEHPAVIELKRLSCLNRLKKMPGMGHVHVK